MFLLGIHHTWRCGALLLIAFSLSPLLENQADTSSTWAMRSTMYVILLMLMTRSVTI